MDIKASEAIEQKTVEIFCCCSSEDQDQSLLRDLKVHLKPLLRDGLITLRADSDIDPGSDREKEINRHLNAAKIILLLISPDFMASDTCYQIEMQQALERHRRGDVRVVPIILRSCDWQHSSFAYLQCLPRNGNPVANWDKQDEAFLAVAEELRRIIGQQRFLPSHLASTGLQNRQRMLKRVREFWIKGVFERSLYHNTLITLGLHERLDAVENPWHFVVQETKRPEQPLSADTRIVQLYDDRADGALLILGKPGAGKTTVLLELAHDLLDRAEADQFCQIPVVLCLSSWAQERLPFTSWLVEELYTKYHVPRNVGKQWVDVNALLLLLDGFDEVKQTQREACLAAINTYRREHNEVPTVVCSRTDEYLAVKKQLEMNYAVVIQPLTELQIQEYLESAGEQLEGLQEALFEYPALRKMATQPLMLNILTLVYQEKTGDYLAIGQKDEDLQQKVLEAYVERMLNRRGINKHYSRQQTLNWLRWLAQQLIEHNQTVFLLERIQPEWLSRRFVRRIYYALTGCMGFLVYGLVLPGIAGVSVAESPLWSEKICFGMITSMFWVHGMGLWMKHLTNTYIGGAKRKYHIEPVEAFFWDRSRLWRWLRQGLLMGFIAGLFSWWREGLLAGLLTWLFMVLIVWLFCGVLFGLGDGSLSALLDDAKHTTPNEGIWLSARNGLLVGLMEIMGIGLVSWGILWLDGGSAIRVIPILLCSGILGFLIGGGLASLQHAVLRVFLWFCGSTPLSWSFVRFLEYSTERILLQRVGGGYMFIHRLLLEYLAQPTASSGSLARPSLSSSSNSIRNSGLRKSPVQRVSRRTKRAKSRKNRTRR